VKALPYRPLRSVKLVTFQLGEEIRVGAVKNDWVVDVGRSIELMASRKAGLAGHPVLRKPVQAVLALGPEPRDMNELLARGEDWRRALDEVLNALATALSPAETPRGLLTPLRAVHLRAPLPRPGKIVCVGRNYAEHARERGAETPAQPIFFLKSSNTICGPGDPIILPPNSLQVDYEAELAVVIGKRGRGIAEERAAEHIAGYMLLNDVSARDMQSQDKQWFRGKSCDTFAPCGPWIVTRDEIPDPHKLAISLTLNGETMQAANTGDMIFKIPFLVSYLSQSLTWEAGDILSTGTPSGIGASRTPPVFLKAGDTVSITVEQIGTLTNPVRSPQES
jgi:2-keto-4-pentenoate hydratase/2-oxohepta-3-ene-1,7-dioic acid hydratase in catechol pathway